MTLLSAHAVCRAYRRFSLVGAGKSTPVLHEVSLAIEAGETVALLGRSGCGKSTLARLLTGLEAPNAGEIRFKDRPLQGFDTDSWQDFRRTVQMVFQDPQSAVNPRLTIGEIIQEPLRHLTTLAPTERDAEVARLLSSVGLVASDAHKYPHQVSGGQLQRVCIARALAPRPALIVLDEAVSNLDLHLQRQTLALFKTLKREFGMAFLFITHDLRLVSQFCTRVLVMDAGRLVEDRAVTQPLTLNSTAGKALTQAVLPALPSRTQRPSERLSTEGVFE